jgi:transcriptional regulator with XRE-family HTH domain
MSTKKYYGVEDLEKKFGHMTLGKFLKSFREADDVSQVDFARKIKVSRANLCDIEKGRKFVSPDRAKRMANILGVPETVLIQLVLQDQLRVAHLNYTIELKKASGI